MEPFRTRAAITVEVTDPLALQAWVEATVRPWYVREWVDVDEPLPGLVLCALKELNVPGVRVVSGLVGPAQIASVSIDVDVDDHRHFEEPGAAT